MKVECHIVAWQESETIALSIKHYQRFCDRIVLHDNFSEDSTREIAESMGCEVRMFGIKGVLDDREYTKLKNNVWKGSDADWVIIVDADEILDVSREALHDLSKMGHTIIKPFGWQIVSNEIPKVEWLEIKRGFKYHKYSKICCFNPKEIKEINYVHGCHVANPTGNVKTVEAYVLYHYKKVGGVQRMLDRYKLYASRMSEWNIRWNAGEQYRREEKRLRIEWQQEYDGSVESFSHGTELYAQDTQSQKND